MISALVAASVEGYKLTEDELLGTCITILIGGHETTPSLIASGLWLVVTQPEVNEQLSADLSLASSAAEEFLCYEPLFQRIVRVANEDVEFHGKTVHRGQTVVLLIGAANWDPRVFASPEVLDIRRAPNRYLSFGYGVHFCLGTALARLEATIAINTIRRRMTSLCPGDTAVEWHDVMVRSLKELRLRFAAQEPDTTSPVE
ncbi:MAG: cytochrome P450 [Verrucomicrobia bacterium]|nr:cytochrome P450 [Verrucomicrobiota bacterium]